MAGVRQDLLGSVHGAAHEGVGRQQPSDFGAGKSIEAEMHAVGLACQGDIETFVEEKLCVATACTGSTTDGRSNPLRELGERLTLEAPLADLYPVDAAGNRGFHGLLEP